jgi:hypothetical protein
MGLDLNKWSWVAVIHWLGLRAIKNFTPNKRCPYPV